MDSYLTAQDIAAIMNLPVATVRWLAHRDKWDRTLLKPRRYRYADVAATMGERQRRADAATAGLA